MQTINYEALLAKYKPEGYISDTANKVANRLICEMRIQMGTGVARFLEVDVSLNNHSAVRVWVQRQLDADACHESKAFDNDELCCQLQRKLYKLFPDLGVGKKAMGIRLKFSARTTQTARDICKAYWAYNDQQDYISFIYQLCHQYNVTTQELFRAIEKCYVCFDEVSCISCGCYYPLEVPADVAGIKGNTNWLCEDCSKFAGSQIIVIK